MISDPMQWIFMPLTWIVSVWCRHSQAPYNNGPVWFWGSRVHHISAFPTKPRIQRWWDGYPFWASGMTTQTTTGPGTLPPHISIKCQYKSFMHWELLSCGPYTHRMCEVRPEHRLIPKMPHKMSPCFYTRFECLFDCMENEVRDYFAI